MSPNKTTDAVKLVLRLPKTLHRRLTHQAKRNSTSLNSEIINELRRASASYRATDPTTELAKHVLDVLPEDVRKRMVQLIAQTGWETVVRAHDQPQEQKKAVGEK
jgi:hypothetical protein